MTLEEFTKNLFGDQLIALCNASAANVVWLGTAASAAKSVYAYSQILAIDLADAKFQPKHLTRANYWNIIFIQIVDSTLNSDGFKHLCYAVYLNYWEEMHVFDCGMEPVCYEEFLSDEYKDSEVMKEILSPSLFEQYIKMKEGVNP